jgi:hypothetical protein
MTNHSRPVKESRLMARRANRLVREVHRTSRDHTSTVLRTVNHARAIRCAATKVAA